MADGQVANPEKLLGWSEARKHLQLGPAGVSDRQIAVDTQLFAAWLIRTNYVSEVGRLIPATWVVMSESELTAMLAKEFGERRLREMFSKTSLDRQMLKQTARNFSVFAAVAVALIWIRKDLESSDYEIAGAKFIGTVGSVIVLNRYFYGRDKAAAQIMAKAMGRYGKWFQGAARTNLFVNFLGRRVAPALLLFDVASLFMSGGLDGPNIPFDFIIEIDVFDSSTWRRPPESGLDFGLDFFYYQKRTERWPVGYQEVCLGVIRGSVFRAPKRWLGFGAAEHEAGIGDRSTTGAYAPSGGGPAVVPGVKGMER